MALKFKLQAGTNGIEKCKRITLEESSKLIDLLLRSKQSSFTIDSSLLTLVK